MSRGQFIMSNNHRKAAALAVGGSAALGGDIFAFRYAASSRRCDMRSLFNCTFDWSIEFMKPCLTLILFGSLLHKVNVYRWIGLYRHFKGGVKNGNRSVGGIWTFFSVLTLGSAPRTEIRFLIKITRTPNLASSGRCVARVLFVAV